MQGHPLKLFLRYMSLNVLGMLSISFYILIDTIFIAQRLGPSGLAALNLAIPIYGLTHSTGLMIGIGGAIKYTVFHSQKKQKLANHVFTATILLAGFLSFIYFIMGVFFYEDVARFLGARGDGEAFRMTAVYVRVILTFSPIYILNNIMIAFIRNDGSPATAMGGMLVSSLTNTLLDYVFLFVLSWGMFGAAFATTLGASLSLLYMSSYMVRKQNSFHFGSVKGFYKMWWVIIVLGLSTFIVDFSYGVVMVLFNRILLILSGTVAVAAFGVIANLAIVVIAVYNGVAQGIQPLITNAYSLGNYYLLKRYLTYGFYTLFIIGLLIYGGIYIFNSQIVSIFNPENDQALQSISETGLRIYFIGLIFAAFNILYAAFFAAIEKPKFGLSVVLLRGFIIIVPAVILMAQWFGLRGTWSAFVLAEAFTLIVTVLLMVLTLRHITYPLKPTQEVCPLNEEALNFRKK